MSRAQWENLNQIFHDAVKLPSDERTAYLDKACAGDSDLRAAVKSLVKSHEKTRNLVDMPVYEAVAEMLGSGTTLQPGDTLRHYRILSLLGEGGMGTVYLAEDTKLHRRVSIKLLPPHAVRDPERLRRFEQEARASSALNHPNVLTIHEIGQEGNRHFIATEFVDGHTLRERLASSIPAEEVLRIAIEVASALVAAHRLHIVHRDIKPENIMIRRDDGLVKVLDFGLAKMYASLSQAGVIDPDAETLPRADTDPGIVMGTVSYMSPEQARALKVDHRSDIFSLGVVLYEMLAGQRPFQGSTSTDVIAAVLTAEPEPLRQYRDDVPLELEQVIAKCLRKDRASRYQSAAELITELKSIRQGSQAKVVSDDKTQTLKERLRSPRILLYAAIATVLVVTAAWYLLGRKTAAVQPARIKSIAVLPLANLSGDPAQEYFADGMTESLISTLSQLRTLQVISRTSVMQFKGRNKPLAEIASELNVDAIIEGSIQHDNGRVKITARLIDPSNETALPSFEYERSLSDVLKLQGEVARTVADEIRIQLTAEDRARLATSRSIAPDAFRAFLLGSHHLRRTTKMT